MSPGDTVSAAEDLGGRMCPQAFTMTTGAERTIHAAAQAVAAIAAGP